MKTMKDLSTIPIDPGCYLFKDLSGKILYVGKAKNLKKRVSSYFQKKDHDPKTQMLISRITDIDFIITPSEVEALILENNLIKKHYPPYNIDLKDARRYAYLKLHSNEEYPFLETVRKRQGVGEYYGPFVSGTIRKYIVDILRRNFHIFLKKPSPQAKKNRDKEEYQQNVARVRRILQGQVDDVVRELTKEMDLSAKRELYEHALIRRNQIQALESLKEKQIMELKKQVDAHIINYVLHEGKFYILLFQMRKGILEGKQRFVLPSREGVFEEFLRQLYTTTEIPKLIIVPEKVDAVFEQYLERIKGEKVDVIFPSKGEKKKLLDLVEKNIHATFFSGLESVLDLGKHLGLTKAPRHIECFDISHLSGTNTVASMVTFIDGKPEKTKYRKFKIQTVEGIDDYKSMEEVILRRYTKSLSESMEFPDLIVIDGGKGQLSSAVHILEKAQLKIPVIGLAKRLEEIFLPNQSDSILLPKTTKGLLLLRSIRDEAHRFAITYQKVTE